MSMISRLIWAVCVAAAIQLASTARAADAIPQPPITVSGAVPDEATRVAILGKVRALYGADRVVDQLTVGGVVTPPNWSAQVQQAISPNLKSVSRGELTIDGSQLLLKGEVGNDGLRQQVQQGVSTNLHAGYTVKNELRVTAAEQSLLDQVLANRIVEFESGSANLTSTGQGILDEMAVAMAKLKGRKVEVVGHTDGKGNRASNLALSRNRAEAVKRYLVGKGIEADMLVTSGMGPDRPVASNDTDDGRRRNRRIEFRIGA